MSYRDHPRFAQAIMASRSDGVSADVLQGEAINNLSSEKTVFHNLSFDGLVGIRNGIWTLTQIRDSAPDCTRAMAKILRNDQSSKLKDLAESLLGVEGATRYQSVDKTNVEQFKEYAKDDALYTVKLFSVLKKRLVQNGQWFLYEQVEKPFILLNLECVLNGISVDGGKLAELISETRAKIRELERTIDAGINYNSPSQLRRYVFGELNQPLVFLKGKVSTSHKALSSIQHPKVVLLVERQKLKGKLTQLESIARFTDVDTGRIHPHMDTLGADTGRCTSSTPNLQNIQKGSELRTLFVASKGHRLVAFDFGQIEPRVLAHFLPEGEFKETTRSDQDLYTAIADRVFKDSTGSVPSRAIVKQVILAVLYGMSPKTMGEALGCSKQDAEEFMRRFFECYPEVETFKREAEEKALALGFSEGLLGRRRYVESHTDPKKQAAASRASFNAVIQGSAATIFKFKLVKLREALPESVRFLLHVHDEVILEVPEEDVEEALKVSNQLLEEPLPWFSIPLIAEGGVGLNWSQAKGV